MSKYLCRNDFVIDYETTRNTKQEDNNIMSIDRMHETLKDIQSKINLNIESEPTLEIKKFPRFPKASKEPLHERTKVTLLASVTSH